MDGSRDLRLSRREFLRCLQLLPLLGCSWRHALGPLSPHRECHSQDQSPPNILVILFDALSARHVPVYGYPRQTMPNLTRFSQKATVFHRHYAAGSFTTPGVGSLLTGVYPWAHRGLHLFGTVRDSHIDSNLLSWLSPTYYTITYTHNPIVESLLFQFRESIDHHVPSAELSLHHETLSAKLFPRDYNVAFWSEQLMRGYSGQGQTSLVLSLLLDLLQNRSYTRAKSAYAERFPRGIPTNSNGLYFVLEDAVDWILDEVVAAPQPFFGYFHLFPPHAPYVARRDSVDRFSDAWTPVRKPVRLFSQGYAQEFLDDQRRLYDEYVAYVDAEFGRLYDSLERAGVLDKTYIIFTSDHGEMFERGIWKHLTPTLYEPIIHIPLIVAKPGQQRRQDVYEPTNCVDLAPTLLQVAGRDIPECCEGAVLPTFGGPELGTRRSVFAMDAKESPKWGPLKRATISLIKEQYKLIHYSGYEQEANGFELYDLERDPEEMIDVYSSQRGAAAALREELEEKLGEANG